MDVNVKCRPELNFSDVPEMMHGAQPGAAPSKWLLARRCRDLQVETPVLHIVEHLATVGTVHASMFPSLDADLVNSLVREASTLEQAIEILLALTTADQPESQFPTTESQPPTTLPVELGVASMLEFPSLCDADGWQVPSGRGFGLGDVSDKTVWCDQAKTVAKTVASFDMKPLASKMQTVVTRRKTRKCLPTAELVEAEQVWADDYDHRQQKGVRRAKRFAPSTGYGGSLSQSDEDVA